MIYGKTHISRCEITFDLLDPGHTVYHPNYLILFDRARSEALKQAGYPLHELWKDGFALALRENTSEYFKPLLMGQSIAILTQTVEAGGPSLRVLQRIIPLESLLLNSEIQFEEGELEVDPKTVIHQVKMHLACIQLNPFRPVRLPQKLVDALALPKREAKAISRK